MATIKKVSKAKNLSAGPSKMTKKAGPVDPKGQYTKVQERTLGSMKKGGSMKKAQLGDILKTVSPVISGVAGLFGKKKQQPQMQQLMGSAMGNFGSMMKRGGKIRKSKLGGSFPDLNKDGKITKADILKGRGVIAKKGMKVKKAQDGIAGMGRGPVLKAPNSAKYPTAKPLSMIEKMNADKRAAKREEEMKPILMPSTAPKTDSLGRPAMKKGGKTFKKTMKTGGKMTKKCAYGCK